MDGRTDGPDEQMSGWMSLTDGHSVMDGQDGRTDCLGQMSLLMDEHRADGWMDGQIAICRRSRVCVCALRT